MPVFDTGLTGQDAEKAYELAATEAEAEGKVAKPFVTGNALANEEQELARNRKLMEGASDGEVDPRKHFRAPAARRAPSNADLPDVPEDAESRTAGRRAPQNPEDKPLFTSDMETIYTPPQEREAIAARGQPETEAPEVSAPETKSSPAASPPPADDEGARLEREILEGADPSVVSSDLPDVEIDVVGRKIPLSRIRAGDDALRNRLRLEQEFSQKNQAMTTAWRRVMEEEARGIRGDLIGAARRLGMSDSEIAAQFARNGLAPAHDAAAPMTSPNVTSLPADADPLAKALFEENRRKDQMIRQLSQRMDGMEQTTAEERVQRSREANERARLATISGVKSDLKATALKMPSMRDASGKLSPLASVLVDSTMLLVDREINAEAVPDIAAVRSRAIHLFGEQARTHGVTSKADQARRAIEQRKPPVPARAGTTNAGVYPGSPTARAAGPSGSTFNWQRDGTDDDLRKRAMRAEMARIEAELSG